MKNWNALFTIVFVIVVLTLVALAQQPVELRRITAPPTGPQSGTLADAVYGTGGDTLATNQIAVGSTATLVIASRTARQRVSITSIGGTHALYCGTSGVTTSTGDYIPAADGASASYQTNAAIYCIVAAGTQGVSYSESY